MSKFSRIDIKHEKGGYYALFIDGRFEGNYDTASEAIGAFEELEQAETFIRELVSA